METRGNKGFRVKSTPVWCVKNVLENVKMAKLHVKMEDFVTAWETSNSVAEVATKLNLKPTSVMARASKYRTAPINLPLKTMKRGSHGLKFDIEGALALLTRLRNAAVTETPSAGENVETETISVE